MKREIETGWLKFQGLMVKESQWMALGKEQIKSVSCLATENKNFH